MKRTVPTAFSSDSFHCLVAPSFACMFNGKDYPPGSVIGDRVCQADGTWRRTG